MRKRPFSSSSETQPGATSVSWPGQGTCAETFRPLIRPILVALPLCGLAGGFAVRLLGSGHIHPRC